jgi:hypothetical protein
MNSFLCMMMLALTLTLSSVAAFAPGSNASRRPSFLSLSAAPPPPTLTQLVSVSARSADHLVSPVNAGIENYLSASPKSMDSSFTLSLQDRHPPTAEEIAAKKTSFNVIFWGGGIVAPFLATVFYFGFKFWEK